VHPSFALRGVLCCIWRPATTRPAFQPGARPPTGGSNPSVSMPARARSHEISEFEFHISPVRSSSRPHTGVGTEGARSRTRCARTTSVATRTGPDTAWARSGMEPPRQRRISYRKCRNRPEPAHPDRPPGHDPAFFPSQVQDRRALDDESVVREPDLQRGVVEIQSRAMLDKRLQRLIELPAQADDVPTCAQGDPVEVDSRCEAPFLLIHAGRPPSGLLARSRHSAGLAGW
jgi:hypothetical protein